MHPHQCCLDVVEVGAHAPRDRFLAKMLLSVLLLVSQHLDVPENARALKRMSKRMPILASVALVSSQWGLRSLPANTKLHGQYSSPVKHGSGVRYLTKVLEPTFLCIENNLRTLILGESVAPCARLRLSKYS